MTPVFLGLDLSLNNTGVAWIDHNGEQAGPLIRGDTLSPPKGLLCAARLSWLRGALRARLAEASKLRKRPVFAAIEGYAMAGSGRVTGLAEWGGVARLLLHEMDIPVLCIAPSSLKLWMAGHGHAKKPAMRKAVVQHGKHLRWRWADALAQRIATEDEIDALALAEAVRQRVTGQFMVLGEEVRKRALCIKESQWETAQGRSPDCPAVPRNEK